MADAAVPQQQYAAPAAVPQAAKEQYIQQTPLWVVVVRGVQVFFSFVIVIMAGILIHGSAQGANGFAVVCGLFTWITVTYMLVTEKVASARGAYEIWAVLALDFLMALFWLASLGANAALRASFNTRVSVSGCYDDGSSVSAHHCNVEYRSVLSKRAAVANATGLALMSAIAGLSALEWLLFVATLVFHGHTYRLWHQEHKKPSVDNATVEMKAQGTPMLAAQDPTAAAAHPQYTDQQQYQSQMYPPHEQPGYQQQQAAAAAAAAFPPQQPQPDAYAQQAAAYPPQQQQPQQQYQQPQPDAYAQQQQQQQQQQPYAAYPDPSQAQYQQQQAYSPHGTPAPGQPYYPPQHPQHPQQQ